MKKFLIFCAVSIVICANCEAKDYAKMHMKQMQKNQEYRIDNTYFADYSTEKKNLSFEIKDPKLIKFNGYDNISSEKLKSKFAKDDIEYKKISKFLASKKVNEYHMQAYSEDFYRIYRIAEKIIRANQLDFINWRLSIDSTTEFNAYNSDTNNITINAGMLDTFRDNDDALAQVLGHEIAHGILGHAKKQAKYDAKVRRAYRIGSYTAYLYAKKRANKVSRDMEFEADIVGAKLAAKAGYDLSKSKEVITLLNTMYYADELNSDHPDNKKRLQNFEQNRTYFMESEWKKQGIQNLYDSKVLMCEKSSNRNSIILLRNTTNRKNSYFATESPLELYLRYGYNSYLKGDFKDSIKYFKKYLDMDKSNYAVYLYLSYAYEYLYKQSGSEKCLEFSKEFLSYATKLAPENKFVKEQETAL